MSRAAVLFICAADLSEFFYGTGEELVAELNAQVRGGLEIYAEAGFGDFFVGQLGSFGLTAENFCGHGAGLPAKGDVFDAFGGQTAQTNLLDF